jgi:hypothetical protein
VSFAVILSLYLTIGLMSAAGSIYISQKILPARFEAVFFGLFLIPIAGFYLAFTAYFGATEAWGLETAAVGVFAVLGCLGTRIPVLLIAGYALHGVWDLLHEVHAHLGVDAFGGGRSTPTPLAYGVFCATYDWCMAAYFHSRRAQWSAAMIPVRA